MPGLEVAVAELARAGGIDVALGSRVPWLSGRGHLHDLVQATAPPHCIDALATLHARLGGDPIALASKALGRSPAPDLVHLPTGCLVEVDEVQHFTTAREKSLEVYPEDLPIGFDPSEYLSLIARWRLKADRAYAHRVATDFPKPGGRQAQRAFNDALRDLLAPTFTGLPVIRLPVPDRSLADVLTRLRRALGGLG